MTAGMTYAFRVASLTIVFMMLTGSIAESGGGPSIVELAPMVSPTPLASPTPTPSATPAATVAPAPSVMPLSDFFSTFAPRATPPPPQPATTSLRDRPRDDQRAGSTLLSALFGAVIGCLATLAGLWARASLDRRRERDYRLADLYAEFVGYAAADVKRCRLQRAELDVRPEDNQNDRAKWLAHWREVESTRHNAHERLLRLRFQLRQLEESPRRRMLIDQVCNVQPHFFRGAGFSQDVEFLLKSAARFEDEIDTFSTSVDSLASSVTADALSGNHSSASKQRGQFVGSR